MQSEAEKAYKRANERFLQMPCTSRWNALVRAAAKLGRKP